MSATQAAHFVHQAIDGRWHAVYRVAGCGTLSSIGDSTCRSGAQAIANEANARLRPAQPTDPYERKLPAGMYFNEDN